MKKVILLFCCMYILAATALAQSPCAEQMRNLPTIYFAEKSARLSDSIRVKLTTVAAMMRMNTDCKVVVTGYCAGSNKDRQLSWDRVNAIIQKHFIDIEGMDESRFIFKFGQKGGSCNKVDLRVASPGEKGPSRVDPPYPQLMRG